jgi:hypothetical protein
MTTSIHRVVDPMLARHILELAEVMNIYLL